MQRSGSDKVLTIVLVSHLGGIRSEIYSGNDAIDCNHILR